MSAFQIGPVVLSAPRLFAAIALAVLLGAAEVVARRRQPLSQPQSAKQVAGHGAKQSLEYADGGWAWTAALVVVAAARLGYVLENLRLFLAAPLSIVQFWQGGFSPWWGVGAGALFLTWAVRTKRVALNAVLLPAVLAFGTWLLVPAILSPAPSEVRQLPNTALAQLEGGELNLASLRGAPVVVNLWATWCPPCRRELPMLAAAASSNPNVRFVFAAQAESRATVEAYLAERAELELTGIVLDAAGHLANEFGTVGLPTTLFFDASGEHVQTHPGELSAVMLVNYLADLGRGEQ